MKTLTRGLVGGLNSKLPPILLPRTQSPDCDNVLVSDAVVSKRGGFIPFSKDRVKMNAVKNAGFHTTSRLNKLAASADGDFLIVPGCLIGGHRPIYEQQTAFTLDLFFQPDDLTGQHGGNGEDAASPAPWAGSPYPLLVRPILSKGPVKRSDDTLSTLHGNASIVWNTTVGTQWGTGAATDGMSFCLYLFNSGTGAAPVWSFRLSAHVLIAGSWTLQTVTSTVPVILGLPYHIVAVVAPTRLVLRILPLWAADSPTYVETTTSFASGTVGVNKCPIQVFDCPQQFIQATAVGSATQRPGLALNTAASGGYWNASKRAEGKIEDIAIWSGDQLDPTNTARDRTTKLDLSQIGAGLIGYWRMLESGTDYVQEVTGRGNHLFFVPRGPISDRSSGGKDGGSWFFNGQTSYALVDLSNPSTLDLANPNWNFQRNRVAQAAMFNAVRDNHPHGIVVDFWADAIEPNFEQVIAEVHSVLRLALDTQGRIVGYCRSGGGAAGTAQITGAEYQGPLVSNVTVVPGRRYSVCLLRREDGATAGALLEVYVNGVLDNSLVVTPVTSASTFPLSSITLGLGSYEHMIRNTAPQDHTQPNPNQGNTDHRSGFVGRIETFKIVGTSSAATLSPNYKPESEEDWFFPETRAWENPILGNRTLLRPQDVDDTVRTAARGAFTKISGATERGQAVRHTIVDPTASQQYTLHTNTLQTTPANGILGHETLDGFGMRIAHAFCYYRFNVDDRDEDYCGAYLGNIEQRYNGGSPTTPAFVPNTTKGVHIQLSGVVDALAVLGAVQRRCIESDITSDTDAVIFSAPNWYTARQRPYRFRAPRQLGPTWAAGMALPLPGQAPISLLHDWEVQTDGRRFTVVAAGRAIYWCKSLWEHDSPFVEAAPESISLAGQPGEHVFLRATSADLFAIAGSTRVFEFWAKPTRLDGRRVLWAGMDPDQFTNRVNLCIAAFDGSIEVFGTEGGGTRTWRFLEGVLPGGGTAVRQAASLRVGAWNHVHVTVDTTVTVRVNGTLVAMVNCNTLAGANQTDPFAGAAKDGGNGKAFIGGLPFGRESLTLTVNVTASTQTFVTKAWDGLLSEFRASTAVDTALWPAAASGYPPKKRYVDDGNTAFLLRFDEGDGWFFRNSHGDPLEHAHSQIRDLIPTGENLEESGLAKYSPLAFRDRLMLSNGESRPQQVIYQGRFASTPFVVRQLGMLAPVAPILAVTLTPATTAGTAIAAGDYQVAVSFISADGTESEPLVIGTHTTVAVDTLVLRIANLPRSADPQVIARNIYVSGQGGGVPLFARQLDENDGNEHDVTVTANLTADGAAVFGERVAPPRGRHLDVAGSNLVIADLPDEPAGQNAFAFSRSDEPSYFTASSFVVLDSKDGKPIIGVRGNAGFMYLSKRDSVFFLEVGAIVAADEVQASVRTLFNSDGLGGGHASAQNMIYGAGDRGVFILASTELGYLSDAIDRTWREQVDRSDNGLVAMSGAYNRPRSQYWLSVRRREQQWNDTILIVEMAVEIEGLGRPWVKLTVPEHSVMAAIESPSGQEPLLVMGTTSGSLLRYSEATSIDGSDDGALANGAQTLEGSAGLSGTATSLTMAGANFDTILGGLAGATVKITTNTGTSERRISRNTSGTLQWTEPLPAFASFTSFVIGGYRGRWSSPWMIDGLPNREQTVSRIGAEVLPQAGMLTIRLASLRQGEATERTFPTTAAKYEEFLSDMALGWLYDMLRPVQHARGHYHRLEFSTDGIRKPFALIAYGIEISEAVATSHAGAR